MTYCMTLSLWHMPVSLWHILMTYTRSGHKPAFYDICQCFYDIWWYPYDISWWHIVMTYHNDIWRYHYDICRFLYDISWWHIHTMTYTCILWHMSVFLWHMVVSLWHILMTYVSMTYRMTYSDPSVAWWHIFMTYVDHDIYHDIICAMTYTCVTMTYSIKSHCIHDIYHDVFSWHMICHAICHENFGYVMKPYVMGIICHGVYTSISTWCNICIACL